MNARAQTPKNKNKFIACPEHSRKSDTELLEATFAQDWHGADARVKDRIRGEKSNVRQANKDM